MADSPASGPRQSDGGQIASRSSGAGSIIGPRRAFFQVASVLLALGAITAFVELRPGGGTISPDKPAGLENAQWPLPVEVPEKSPSAAPSAIASSDSGELASAGSVPEPATEPAAPAVPEPDRARIAEAEASLDAVSRDRERAEARAATAARSLAQATAVAALDAARARKLAYLVRDPSTRIAVASSRGGFLRGERDKLQKDVTTLRQLPRPKSATILSRSPVARPASSEEYHFELRRDRVTFINLERLMELCKSDAQIRIRMADRAPEIASKVGPVGAFSLAYELAKATPGTMEELIQRKSVRFDLRAWELLPESENRGETYEATRNPISEFSRAVNRMSPSRSTVTLWVYPDSFALYRRLRAELVEHGFSVAGRPLPEGMTIRGSPLGTQSAAQ
jgi:hypothetical protein